MHFLNQCFQDQESEGALSFKKAAAGIDDVPFAITSEDSVFKEYKMDKDGIVLLKKVRKLVSACMCVRLCRDGTAHPGNVCFLCFNISIPLVLVGVFCSVFSCAQTAAGLLTSYRSVQIILKLQVDVKVSWTFVIVPYGQCCYITTFLSHNISLFAVSETQC